MLSQLLDGFLASEGGRWSAWYYTPMMLPFWRHIEAIATVYDCMDELANFRFAPPELLTLEQELLDRADVVFTGGFSLYEAKKDRHPNVHPFPSSVDRAHFLQARGGARRAGRPGGHPRPPLRLLRRHRRADGPRPARRASPMRVPTGRSSWSVRS